MKKIKSVRSKKKETTSRIKKEEITKVLFVSSEISGIVKTGGLGDVTYSLPLALTKLGLEVIIVLPFYKHFFSGKASKTIEKIETKPGDINIGCSVYKTKVQSLTVYLLEHDHYFSRKGIYDEGYHEYKDNPERFCLLSSMALKLAETIGFIPDVVHCNDWQTALTPLYLQRLKATNPDFKKTKSVLTIHNGSFQGKFSKFYFGFLGIKEAFNFAAFEEFGYINTLKGGIFYADYVTTVSPGYASELLTSEGGHGLHLSYQQKKKHFLGILNGCDYSIWNPENDEYIAKNFSVHRLEGKKKCKLDLLKRFGIANKIDYPVIGLVSRLTSQKGFYYSMPAIFELAKKKVVFIILGSGDKFLVDSFQYLRDSFPNNVGWYNGYHEELAHSIEAGSDFFLMPSLFEPCGLNQMYSQCYGSLPIVRSVGGLKDTVFNFNLSNLEKSNGFVFEIPTAEALYNTATWALDIYKNQPKNLLRCVKNAMLTNYSWEESAKKYIEVYKS